MITLASGAAPPPSRPLLGVPLGLRAVLAEQRAGAKRVAIWPAGQTLAWLDDPRVTVPVEVLDTEPEEAGGYGVVAGVRLEGEAAWREAERRLLATCRKSTDGWVSRYLNRPVSLALSRHLASWGVRPNAMTAVTLVVALLGAGLVAQGTYGTMVFGAGLLHLSSVLDGCDGELARLTFRSTARGAWLDTVGDDLAHLAYWAALAVAARATGASTWPLGWVAMVANALAAAITYRRLWRMGEGDWFAVSPPTDAALLRGITLLFRRDSFLFGLWLAALADRLLAALPVVAAGATLTLGATLLRQPPPKR